MSEHRRRLARAQSHRDRRVHQRAVASQCAGDFRRTCGRGSRRADLAQRFASHARAVSQSRSASRCVSWPRVLTSAKEEGARNSNINQNGLHGTAMGRVARRTDRTRSQTPLLGDMYERRTGCGMYEVGAARRKTQNTLASLAASHPSRGERARALGWARRARLARGFDSYSRLAGLARLCGLFASLSISCLRLRRARLFLPGSTSTTASAICVVAK